MEPTSRLEAPARASRVEIASLVVVMIVVLFGGRAVIATLSRFPAAAGSVLFAIAIVEGAALVRTLRTAPEAEARIRASRDAWAFVAALLGVTAVLTHASWAAGAAIAAVEFTFAVELLRQLRPQGSPDVA